jgi:hypothetical protein
MFKLIEKLQSKSKASRRRTAFIIAFIFTVIIFVIWLSTLGPRLANQDIPGEEIDTSPIETMKGILKRSFDSFGRQEYQQN